MARRKYRRRSHLAEEINRSSPGMQKFWACVIVIAFVFAIAMLFRH
ncbi:hypothetical protein [Cupriavidus sp. CuC1]